MSDEFSPRTNFRRNTSFNVAAKATLRNFLGQCFNKELSSLGIVKERKTKVDSVTTDKVKFL